jgi:hypothetical protein
LISHPFFAQIHFGAITILGLSAPKYFGAIDPTNQKYIGQLIMAFHRGKIVQEMYLDSSLAAAILSSIVESSTLEKKTRLFCNSIFICFSIAEISGQMSSSTCHAGHGKTAVLPYFLLGSEKR